jgi:hypothetical protein
MLPSFELTGSGATGIIVDDNHRAAVAELPVSIKLGRKAPRARPCALRLELYTKATGLAPPASADWYTKAAPSIARMYRNNVKGCCVISGKAHNLGVWSANDPDSGPIVLASDSEIDEQYVGICGPGDNGCYIPDVLDTMVHKGFKAGGKYYKLLGYAAFDWRSKEMTQTAIQLGGAISIGFNIPGAWMNTSVWRPTNSGIVGGHDVSPIGYGKPTPPVAFDVTDEGVIVASWGRLYLFTWDAWLDRRYVDEAYFMVPEELWTGLDKTAPSGVKVDELLKDMALIKGGTVPPLPDPNPPPPPPPGACPAGTHWDMTQGKCVIDEPDPVPTKPQVVNVPALSVYGPAGRNIGSTRKTTLPVVEAANAAGPDAAGGAIILQLLALLRKGLPIFCAIAPTLPIPPAYQTWVKLLCSLAPPPAEEHQAVIDGLRKLLGDDSPCGCGE